MMRKITPTDTCVPWKPVIMKNVEPNCAAPSGLPHGRTPSSMISLVHSNACMPTNVAPSAAVSIRKMTVLPPVLAIAVVDGQRHRAAAADQHERHDRDQDQRDALARRCVSAKTSLGFGHGAVVDIRTVMYEVRKRAKMNVSESRKIHIIALPQGTS